MAGERTRLSERELHQLLERAIVREAQDGGQLPEGTLAEIGDELGLDAAHVREVLADHIAHKRAKAAGDVVERPFDTKIVLRSSPQALDLTIPGRGLHPGALFTLCFATPWLAFVAQWSFGMAKDVPIFAALFSIPFWAIGLGLVYGALRACFGETRIVLSRTRGSIDQRPFAGRTRVDPRRLTAELVTTESRNARHGTIARTTHLVLEHGTRTWKLLGEHSDIERRWLQGEVERWLQGP